MKFLLVLIVAAGAFYWYSSSKHTEIVVNTYQDLLKKVDVQAVSLSEVKAGSQLLAESFCKDEMFQSGAGTNAKACMSKLGSWKDICISEVFDNAPDVFTEKSDVVDFAKRYAKCTGSIG